MREIPDPGIPKQTPRSSAPTDVIVTGQIPVGQTKGHLLTMSNLSIVCWAQGEEGRPSSMPRLEDVGRPVHTMKNALQERVGFPTQIVHIDVVYSSVEGCSTNHL